MADREYKVVYKSRIRDQDVYEAENDNRRYRRHDYGYDDERGPRRSGDYLERISTQSDHGSIRQQEMALAPRPRHNTRTEYDFVDRDEPYGRSGNAIILDSRDRDLTEWEIIRPERSESGAIIIETGGPRGRYDYEVVTAPRPREKSIGRSRSIVDAMMQVQVTEDPEDDRRSVYSRRERGRALEVERDMPDAPMAPRRMPSAFRHEHSPSSDTRRHERSIGFHKTQIRDHDATERRHERPGTEAALAGQYLIDHRGERLDEDFDGRTSLVSRTIPRSRSKRRHKKNHDEEVDYERRERYYEEDINRDFDRRSRPYSPQRAPSPARSPSPEPEPERERRHRRHRRRHRHREEDDDRSYVSEHYRRVDKEYRD
ncbi:uncharacterized protein HMPREF1541_00306 [Cyphellophora europaea CBS 101466]|uniref:Uncharacterized protein n=1 Tax=Cyphellophora europaea (strain CBS 101466) TaxID=1220924 RepID=W2SBP2_CYPE1|nr:uncharacterized protein HMPREF1541_00306 [Cyphellophora europaea CBS 101466]ETN46122.1 hypothetical protein HMPREF1541_00306 [Cyphellophora europaea CBS 101466]